MTQYWHFVGLIRKELYGAMFGIFMSFIATFSSIALMSTATWFLSAMAVCGFYDVVLNIFIPSALIRLLAVSRTLLRYAERYYTHDATFRLIAYLRVFLFERALDLRIEDALKLKSSDLQRRMQSDLERLEMIYVRQFVPFTVAALMGLVAGGVLLAFSPLMAFTALALMILAGVIVPYVLTIMARDYSVQQSELAVKLNDDMSDFIHGFFDLVLLGKHVERAVRFLNTAQDLARARARIIFYDQLSQVFLIAFAELTLFLLLIQCVPLVVAGQMSSAQMMMLSVGAMATYEVLVPLSAAFLNLPYVTHSAERVGSLLHITRDNADINPNMVAVIKEEEDNYSSSSAAAAARGGLLTRFSSLAEQSSVKADINAAAQAGQVNRVELRDVSFHYELSDGQYLQVLNNFSCSFGSDENYVIKAPSGRGKSTMVLLMTSLLYPQKGELMLNGRSYASMPARDIRASFAVALQDISLFSGTVFETFRQIRPDVTRDEVMAVLTTVELDSLIEELPGGLDEWLGSTGLTISGGQARRLCLARALVASGFTAVPVSGPAAVRADSQAGQAAAAAQGVCHTITASDGSTTVQPACIHNGRFLVLDEPGEGLDEEQELRIIERIQSMRKGVIIITHKQAGTRLADHLLTL